MLLKHGAQTKSFADVREMEEVMMGPSPALLPVGTSGTKPRARSFKRQHRRVIFQLPAAGYDDEDLDDLNVPALPAAPEPESADPHEAAGSKRAKIMAEDVVSKSKGTVKKVAREISKKAHANYKRVNIDDSKGAKAGNGDRKFFRR
ncbi:hypothetical protein Q9L58_006867 [Maublancomyces gigas]|uniref:Uncharacterized protein n=1 Tax=Discina gigas TaxID=1032678 RepID=A0ABR3GDZ2_9PEZI